MNGCLKLLEYFRNDTQLRDILLTGGDALMTSDKNLKKILDEIYNMAVQKREDNKNGLSTREICRNFKSEDWHSSASIFAHAHHCSSLQKFG